MSAEKIRVLFICDKPDFRCYKLAKALKDSGGVEPFLLANSWDPSFHGRAFTSAKSFGRAFALSFTFYNTFRQTTRGRLAALTDPFMRFWVRNKMMGSEPFDIVHAMAPPVSLSRLAVECASTLVIFDQYDLLMQTSGDRHRWPSEIQDEIFCLGNADGLVHKGPRLELDFYREKGHKVTGSEISFPDGCDEALFQPVDVRKLRHSDNAWHVVYAGGIHGPGKEYYLLPFFTKLTDQGIHVHVYPAKWSQDHEELGAYHETAKACGLLHMYGTIPYANLVREISRYDFGLYYFEIDSTAFPDMVRKARTAAGNKIPTYYEAGLPVLIAEKIEYSAGFISEDRSGILLASDDVPKLRSILDRCDYAGLQRSVSIARVKWSGRARAEKLIRFYKDLLSP